MPKKILTVDEVLAQLETTPQQITELTDGLSRSRLHSSVPQGEWSAIQVLAHLRACADVWGGCMSSILDGERTIRAVNPRSWIERTDYVDLDFKKSLKSFVVQRSELLARLRPLPRAAWSRSAEVTGAGAPLRHDVLYFGQRMAVHERAHVKQVARIVGAGRDSN